MLDFSELVKSVVSRETARSQQITIGPSEVGLCRRKTWYRLRGQERTNETPYRLSAFMGTAIHDAIERELRQQDPDGVEFWPEIACTGIYDGIKITGHVDLYVPAHRLIVDWKTITKSKRSAFPSQSHRYQVHLYAWLLRGAGHEVTHVAIVGLCRDGNEDDVVVHCEPVSDTVLAAAFDWLREAHSDEMPPADQQARRFCARYCQFYDATGQVGCEGQR